MVAGWQVAAVATIGVGSILLVLWASARDVCTRAIPNWLVLGVGVLSFASGGLARGIAPGIASGIVVFVLGVFCWRRGWIGGADAKLLGAVALGITPALIAEFIVAVALAGGVLSLFYLIAIRITPKPASTKRPARFLLRILRVEQWRIHRGCPLPYACAIAAGTLYVHF